MRTAHTRRFLAIALIAVGYYLLGQFAAWTAIPPSYAAPVWPAAGLALVGLLYFGNSAWPGIILGSLALTLAARQPGGPALPAFVFMTLGLAVGATVQALAAAALVRRCSTVSEGDDAAGLDRSVSMLLLSGPIACLVSPTVGIAIMAGAGVLGHVDVGFNWFTWWVGDSIGTLVGLTLFLVWTRARGSLSQRGRVLATMPMLVLMGVISLLFLRTSALDRETAQDTFTHRSELIAHNLEQKLAEYTEALHAVAGFLTVTNAEIDRDGFRRFVADMLRRHPNLHAMSWSPLIADEERAAYEHAMRAEGYAPDGIRALDAGGRLLRAPPRAAYVPVTFMEPIRNNTGALGFDLLSEPVRRAALERARDTGGAATSSRVGLVHVRAERSGVLIVAAAYRAGMPYDTVEQRRRAVRGYVSAVLRVEVMMADFLRGIDLRGMRIRLTDLGVRPGGELLAELPRAVQAAPAGVAPVRAAHAGFVHRVTLLVGDRPWEFAFTLDDDSPLQAASAMSWSARVVGLLFTALLSTFLLVTVGRTVAIERQVERRTAQLRDSNAALQLSSAGLARSEQALRVSEEEARSIVDTARDAYIAIDPRGQVVAWNREAERILGWPREQAMDRYLAQLLLLPGRTGPGRTQRIVCHLASGRTRLLNRRIETLVQHRDGHILPVELVIWATRHAGERRFHVFMHDISRRRQAVQRLAAQEAAAAALLESGTLADAAPRVLQATCEALGWWGGLVWMIDTAGEHLHCCAFWSHERQTTAFEAVSRGRRLGRGEGFAGHVWQERRPAWVSDIAQDGQFAHPPEAGEAHLHAAFAFPITAGGDVLGVVECFSHRVADPDPGLLTMMETVGSLLGQFIARRRAEAALFEEKERAQVTLGSIGDGVIVTDTENRVTYLNPVAETLTGWSAAQAIGRPVEQVFRLVAQGDGSSLPSPLASAIHGNRRVGLGVETELVRRDGARLGVEDSAAPVHDRSGQVVGGVVVFHDVSDARAMQMKLSHLTRHDHLTSLPNRALMQERLAQALDRARMRQDELAVLYIDLDGFKHINDSLGHDVGDLLLQQVTGRLLDSVRAGDTVSRQGGDDFTVLLPETRSSDAIRVAEQILQAVRQPFVVGGAELNLTTSVGIALHPADGDDAGVLLKHADAAMYRAKQSGRNQYRFFTPEISERADRRLAVESALHQALRNRELVLHYQPKVAPATGALTGMEALVRWQRPGGELVMPGEFITVAEECGLIGRIDQWVLEEACRQNRAWQDAGLVAVPVAVNLSAANTQIARFPAYLAEVLRNTGLAPAYLQIEMTESQLVQDTGGFEALIRDIKALGVKVAIDDFGTGYSSLGYLQRFPFDVLKIDQSFVKALRPDSTESAIVEAITRLAHAFGFAVVAEGVETEEQARLLQGFGCHEMQGYLYSRPLPSAQIEALLEPHYMLSMS